MSFARISMYYHSLQKKISRAVPWCCDDMCMELWDSPAHEAWHKREHGYVMFVKAIMLSTKKGVVAR